MAVKTMTSSHTRGPWQSAPTAEDFDHARFYRAMRIVLDLGGEEGGPIVREERQAQAWELNTYAICEYLSSRGVWTNVGKLRRSAELGDKYLAVPYSARFLLAARPCLSKKRRISRRLWASLGVMSQRCPRAASR
jgi:hypothetical protein